MVPNTWLIAKLIAKGWGREEEQNERMFEANLFLKVIFFLFFLLKSRRRQSSELKSVKSD